jgi:DNA-binding FadR family transcriptional regulator
VLESRQGKGMLIRRADPAHAVARCLPFYPHSADDLSSLSRLRYVIEIGAVDLVIAGASQEQIESLNKLARDYAVAVEGSHGRPKIQQINQLDLAYHQLLLEMTHDSLVTDMHQVLARYFNLENQTRRSWQPQQASVWEHTAMAQAIRDRDVERTRALLRQHLKGLLKAASDKDRGES